MLKAFKLLKTKWKLVFKEKTIVAMEKKQNSKENQQKFYNC